MAIAFVRNSGHLASTASAGGELTVAITAGAQGNTWIVAIVATKTAGASEIKDSAGDTFEKDASESDGVSVNTELWSAPISSTAVTALVLHGLGAATLVEVSVYEFSGVAAASRVRSAGGGEGTGTAVSAETFTGEVLKETDLLLAAFGSTASSGSFTAGGGATALTGAGQTGGTLGAEYLLKPTAGAQGKASGTFSLSAAWTGAIAAYKAAASGPTFTAAAAGSSGVKATLTTPRLFTAVAAGTSSAKAALRTPRLFTAVASGTAHATAALSSPRLFGALAAGVSGVKATLQTPVSVRFTAVAHGLSGVVASLRTPPSLRLPLTSQTVDVSIRAEVLNGVWETFGVDREVEVDPESLTYEFDAWGALKASFVLKRNPWGAWPDLSPFTPVEIEVGGVLVWAGRIDGTPLKAGAEGQISVQCEGWAFHLDDDLYKHTYVHSMLSDWKDFRGQIEAPLSEWPSAPTVSVEGGTITIGVPKGSSIAAGGRAGVYLTFPQEDAIKTVSFTFGENTFPTGHFTFYAQAFYEGGSEILVGVDAGSVANDTVTITTAASTLIVFIEADSTAVTEEWALKLTGISIFSEEAYESGGSSILKASTVIQDALARATVLLSSDLSQINPYVGTGDPEVEDDFDIPSLVMGNYKTPRQMIEGVNSFHNWLTMIDMSRCMVFKPPSDSPLLEWGAWSGEEIEDASAGEGADIYNRVVVEGTEASGDPLDVSVDSAELTPSTETLVDERGFRRSKTISLSNATTETGATKVGEVWLSDQLETPFGGSLKANVGSLRMVLGGQPVDPSLIGYHLNELLRVSQAIDPNTGGVGRDGRIVTAVYEHAGRSAQVTLGARTSNIEALLARLAVVQEVGS